MAPSVSVIIPVYNGERFISRAIDSVLKQTYPAFEIIVVNDGSTDSTEKLLESYKDRIIVKTIPNGGVSRARNAGIQMSRGEWVAFLDSDDEWDMDKLKRQVALLSKDGDAGMIFSSYDLLVSKDGQDRTIGFNEIHPLGSQVLKRQGNVVEDCFYLLFVENFIKTSTVMMRREVLTSAGLFDESLKTVEDRDLFIRVADLTKTLFARECLVHKWNIESSLGQESLQVINDRERVQWLNWERFHDKIVKAGKVGMIHKAIKVTKKGRLIHSIRSCNVMGSALSVFDFLMFKAFRINTNFFVK